MKNGDISYLCVVKTKKIAFTYFDLQKRVNFDIEAQFCQTNKMLLDTLRPSNMQIPTLKQFFSVLTILLSFSSCSHKLIGTYISTTCCMGMGCQIVNLKENNKYEDISWGDIMGIDTVRGTYKRNSNVITLNPILPYEYRHQESFVKMNIGVNIDPTIIQFYSLPAIITKVNFDIYHIAKDEYFYRLNRCDTVKDDPFFKINKVDYSPNALGMVKAKLQKNDTIVIFHPLSHNPIFTYVVKESNIDTLNIFYATEGENPNYRQVKFRLKKNGLYPLTKEFPTEFLVKKTVNYKCLGYQERKVIRDTLFKLIYKNTDKQALDDLDYNRFYIVFNEAGRVKKVILDPSEEDGISLMDKMRTVKQRDALKKALSSYQIPIASRVSYNLMVLVILNYYQDTNTLELKDF